MTASDSGRRLIDGRFELLERLGAGGMGLVWRARDTALHREVALKEVRPPDPERIPTPRRRPRCASACCARPARWPGCTTPMSRRSTTSWTKRTSRTPGS